MPEIILTEEQTRVIAEAKVPVEIRDTAGTILIKVDPYDARALAIHRRRVGQPSPGIPGRRVLEHLQALQQEWDRIGGFDSEFMKEFVSRLRAEEGAPRQ
jgi:hypothetical protein